MADRPSDDVRLEMTLAHRSTWIEPRPALEDRVVQAVLGAPRAVPARVTALRPSAVPQHHARVPRRRRARFPAAAAVVAIAIAIAGAGGVLAGGRHDTPDFEGRLTASAIAPGAHGSAQMYKTDAGFRVELDARGLPRLTGAEYFQAWVRNAAGAGVPIGTFSANGGDVVLWSGVSPEQFPAFSVTIEPADNDQRPSGRRVLGGEMRAR